MDASGLGGARNSPQREAAIRYLAAQIAEYRADLAMWRGARKAGGGLIQRMVISPLQGLIEDRMQLLSKLRGKPDLSSEGELPEARPFGAGGEAGQLVGLTCVQWPGSRMISGLWQRAA